MSRLTTRVREVAGRAGMEAPLLWLWERRYPEARTDRLDNDRLRALLAYTLSEDSNCVDVGCHRGEVLAEMVHLAPRGHHIAYEPVAASHAALVARFPGVDVRNAAVSDTAGEAPFVVVPDIPSYSGLRERSYRGDPRLEHTTVRTERLDDALPAGYVPRVIKVDVEGAELAVFEGARETLRRHKPIVWFEHGTAAQEGYDTGPRDIHRLLCGELGMRIFGAAGQGPYGEDEFAALGSEPVWNFVAHA